MIHVCVNKDEDDEDQEKDDVVAFSQAIYRTADDFYLEPF